MHSLDGLLGGLPAALDTVLDHRGAAVLALLAALLAFGLVARVLLLRERRLAPPEVQERIDAGLELLVIDVRPRAAFARGHIAGAVNVPLTGLRGALRRRGDALPQQSDHVVVVVADTMRHAERGAERLRRAGFNRVYVVEGGMRGWCADRLPLAGGDDGGLAAAGRH